MASTIFVICKNLSKSDLGSEPDNFEMRESHSRHARNFCFDTSLDAQ